MASPATIGATATGASAAGGILGFVGNVFGGIASKQMYDYQSAIAQYNSQIAKGNEDYAITSGEQQAATSGLQTRFTAGQTASRYGAGNIAVTSGSAADVAKSIHDIGEFNQSTIRNNAARVAYGYATEAVSDTAQSNLYKMAGNNALLSGTIKGFGSLVSGATSVSSKFFQGSSVGLGGGSVDGLALGSGGAP